MKPPLHSKFVKKAHSALTAAVQVYNNPASAYRDENFALLCLNAWEILLKARILQLNKNSLRSIRVYAPKKTKTGAASKKKYMKKNRSGNPMTQSLNACVEILRNTPEEPLTGAVALNLQALTEIRDNAAHFIYENPLIAKSILEIGCASISNFVAASKKWFDSDLSESLSLFLPLAYVRGDQDIKAITITSDESRLINYLKSLASQDEGDDQDFKVAVQVDVKISKSKLDTASKIIIANEPGAVKVVLSEEEILKKYPWDYKELIKQVTARYSDLTLNKKFHNIRKVLMGDQKYARSRFLDPKKPGGMKKDFYSASIVNEFDKHYTKRAI